MRNKTYYHSRMYGQYMTTIRACASFRAFQGDKLSGKKKLAIDCTYCAHARAAHMRTIIAPNTNSKEHNGREGGVVALPVSCCHLLQSVLSKPFVRRSQFS